MSRNQTSTTGSFFSKRNLRRGETPSGFKIKPTEMPLEAYNERTLTAELAKRHPKKHITTTNVKKNDSLSMVKIDRLLNNPSFKDDEMKFLAVGTMQMPSSNNERKWSEKIGHLLRRPCKRKNCQACSPHEAERERSISVKRTAIQLKKECKKDKTIVSTDRSTLDATNTAPVIKKTLDI